MSRKINFNKSNILLNKDNRRQCIMYENDFKRTKQLLDNELLSLYGITQEEFDLIPNIKDFMQLIENATKQKLRGGFYSPKTISDFILRWAFNGNKSCDILEPSAGDGVFIESLVDGHYEYNSVTAIEIEKEEATKVKKIPAKNLSVLVQDFHRYCNNTNAKYDIIIGNPPYIRYQYFKKEQQLEAEKYLIEIILNILN